MLTSETDTSLTRITEKETMEFFSEGLKQAESAARQLGILQNHFIWHDISSLLQSLRSHGIKLARSKPLTRSNVLSMLDIRQKRMAGDLDGKRPKKFII